MSLDDELAGMVEAAVPPPPPVFSEQPANRVTVELPEPDETDSEHSEWTVGPFTVAVNDDGTVNLVTSAPGHTFGDQVDIAAGYDVAYLLGLALLAAARTVPAKAASDAIVADLVRLFSAVPPGHPCAGCPTRLPIVKFACLPCLNRLPARLSHELAGASGDVSIARAMSEAADWFTVHPSTKGGA